MSFLDNLANYSTNVDQSVIGFLEIIEKLQKENEALKKDNELLKEKIAKNTLYPMIQGAIFVSMKKGEKNEKTSKKNCKENC